MVVNVDQREGSGMNRLLRSKAVNKAAADGDGLGLGSYRFFVVC